MRDYYTILGVGEYATQQQIKTAFRKLCMQYHPDKTGGNPALEEKFRQILVAYEVLRDPVRKYNYDQRLAHQRAAAAQAARRPQPSQRYYTAAASSQQTAGPLQGKTYSFYFNIQLSARFPKKAMAITGAVFVLFFVLLYLFGPVPRNPAAKPETATALPPITSGLIPKVADPDPVLILPGREEQRLASFLAGGDTTHSFLNMDGDDIPELVAGNYLFAPGADGKYRLVFHYGGAMYVQHNRLFLYFNDLVGEYRSCLRCGVKQLPNDESIAEIRMVYDSGRVIFPETDKYRSIAILENLRYLFRSGIPAPDALGNDDGTRKELLRHFIAYHFNQRDMALTARLFQTLYAEPDKDAVWRDLEEMIVVLGNRIISATPHEKVKTSATPQSSNRGYKSHPSGSNRRPVIYETTALTN